MEADRTVLAVARCICPLGATVRLVESAEGLYFVDRPYGSVLSLQQQKEEGEIVVENHSQEWDLAENVLADVSC